MDTGQFHIHSDRYVWSKQGKLEYAVHRNQWSRWWHTSKAFQNKRDGRTFAEVVKQPAQRVNSLDTETIHNGVEGRSFPSHKQGCRKTPTVKTGVRTSKKIQDHKLSEKFCTFPQPLQTKTTDSSFCKNKFAILETLLDSDVHDNHSGLNDKVDRISIGYKDVASDTKQGDANKKTKPTGLINKNKKLKNQQRTHTDVTNTTHPSGELVNNVTSQVPQKIKVDDSSPNDNGQHLATIPIYSTLNSYDRDKDCIQQFRRTIMDISNVYQNYDNTFDMNTHPIPQGILENKYACTDYNKCIQQTASHIGFVPLTPLELYVGMEKEYEKIPDIFQAHTLIRQSGKPNFLGCRIPIQGQLKAHRWKHHLKNYWDQQLPDLISYGFPLDFDRNSPLQGTLENHKSALDFPSDIQKYIDEELQFGAMVGPFLQYPIPTHVSPLMTRSKQNSTKRRTIMDLSWPPNFSVNHGVSKHIYLNTYFQLQYPSIDNITNALNSLGPGAMLYKVDIRRAFRHIRVDPGDIDLLGLSHNGLYTDLSLPFGFRHGSIFFTRCSDAIRHIMRQNGFPGLWNYIDDLIYTGLPSNIHNSYQFLLNLLQDLGLAISPEKLVAPTTTAICLGILVDTKARTISIPTKKLLEIKELCKDWVSKKYATKNQFQSLLGSLLYITKCVKPARFFLNRMLALFRSYFQNQRIPLSASFFKDLNWFNTFLNSYNGITYYDSHPVDESIFLDACLTGLGGVFQQFVYAIPMPRDYKQYHINHLEMINMILFFKNS